MNIERLNEPTKVRVDFEAGQVRPILFKHSGRTCKVERQASTWEDKSGGAKVVYFSVEFESSVYQLSWRVLDNLWYVDAVMLEG